MHKAVYDDELKIITVEYGGKLSMRDLEKGSADGARLILAHDCYRVLVDISRVRFDMVQFSVMDLPATFARVMARSNIELGLVKRALLVRQINEDHLYIENVAIKRGNWVRLFDDRDQAVAWLQE